MKETIAIELTETLKRVAYALETISETLVTSNAHLQELGDNLDKIAEFGFTVFVANDRDQTGAVPFVVTRQE